MSVFDSFKSIIFDDDDEDDEEKPRSGRRNSSPSIVYLQRREDSLKRLYKGVEVRNRRYRFKNYRRCFVGSEAVDFMVQSGWATSRDDAVRLGRSLQKEFNLFEHVVDPDRHPFKDEYIFYRFTTTDLEGSFSSVHEDSSTDEESSEIGEGSFRRSHYLSHSLLHTDAKMLGLTAIGGILRRGVNQKYNFKFDKEGFYADEAVDYMVSTGLANSRPDAESIGRGLQRKGAIENTTSTEDPFKDVRIFFYFPQDGGPGLHSSNWENDLEEACQFFKENIKRTDHTYRLRTYKETFTGKEAVDLFLMAGFTSSRPDAVLLGRALMVEYNLFGHVVDEHEFEDSELFYKFSK